jgi:hypothetical protein
LRFLSDRLHHTVTSAGLRLFVVAVPVVSGVIRRVFLRGIRRRRFLKQVVDAMRGGSGEENEKESCRHQGMDRMQSKALSHRRFIYIGEVLHVNEIGPACSVAGIASA